MCESSNSQRIDDHNYDDDDVDDDVDDDDIDGKNEPLYQQTSTITITI